MKRTQRTARIGIRGGAWLALAVIAFGAFVLAASGAPQTPSIAPGATPPAATQKLPATAPAGTPPAVASNTTYNVRSLGAVGDGTTDDAPAVQRALDKVGVSGGVVLFP